MPCSVRSTAALMLPCVGRAAGAHERHRVRGRVHALQQQLTRRVAVGRHDVAAKQHVEAVARRLHRAARGPTAASGSAWTSGVGSGATRFDTIGSSTLTVHAGLLAIQAERDSVRVGARLDQHEVGRRIDPLEVEAGVGVDGGVEADRCRATCTTGSSTGASSAPRAGSRPRTPAGTAWSPPGRCRPPRWARCAPRPLRRRWSGRSPTGNPPRASSGRLLC